MLVNNENNNFDAVAVVSGDKQAQSTMKINTHTQTHAHIDYYRILMCGNKVEISNCHCDRVKCEWEFYRLA